MAFRAILVAVARCAFDIEKCIVFVVVKRHDFAFIGFRLPQHAVRGRHVGMNFGGQFGHNVLRAFVVVHFFRHVAARFATVVCSIGE